MDSSKKSEEDRNSSAEVETYPEFVVFREGYRAQKVVYHPGETIVETARRAGIFINTNCVQGYCGTCTSVLHKGNVKMRKNKVLTKDDLAGGRILACQSIPITDTCEVKLS